MEHNPAPVLIVGAGVAGLTCARELVKVGIPVQVLESDLEIGGDLRQTRDDDGYSYDRGFQVLLSAYPALKRQIDLDVLGWRAFDAGAMVWTGKRLAILADPLRHPSAAFHDITTNVLPLRDKLRLMQWAVAIRRTSWHSAADAAFESVDDRSALEELQARGFSTAFIDRFARPFWGGISLDPSLGFSAGVLKFTLAMFLRGSAVLPKDGAGAVPAALAGSLPAGAIRTSTRVDAIEGDARRVTAVRLEDGALIPASAVVVATDPRSARGLTGIEQLPTETVACVTVYLAGTTDPGVGRMLVLDGTGARAVNHIAPMSSVQPGLAPPGSHLIAAVMLGNDVVQWPDERITEIALTDVGVMLGQADAWQVRRIVRLPDALFRQPPGIHRQLPDVTTGRPGVFLAGSATVDASVNGALLSGETAARAVRNFRTPVA